MNEAVESRNADQRRTVGIISADPVERNKLVRHLRDAGYSVLEAASATEAAQLAANFKGDIDAILIDDRRGGLNGSETAATVTRFRPATKIVLRSALDNSRSFADLHRSFIHILRESFG